MTNKRVLGIDPGFDRLGIAVLTGNGSKPIHLYSECIIVPKGTASERLASVTREIEKVIAKWEPTHAAIEGLLFSTNKKTAIAVAEARGAILATLGLHNLPVTEALPVQVKIAVAGYGGADKKAVELMVKKLIPLPEKKRLDDEFDALSVALYGLSTLPG